MDKVIGDFEKCDECESLIDVYVEFHSRRGDFVKVCMNCLANAITAQQSVQPDEFNGHAYNCDLSIGGLACTCGKA